MRNINDYLPDNVDIPHKALVVEGGAMRSVFSAGLLDGFLSRMFNPFDFYIGVSGGAYNLATYMAGTPGKSLEVYLEFASDRKFINYLRFFGGGHLLDLDWLFEESLADNFLDIKSIFESGKRLYVCTTNVNSGEPVYIDTTPDNLIIAIKASTALPLLFRNFPAVNGLPMTDGGVSDGIPVAKAIELGATQVMVIRSRHKNYMKKDTMGHRYIRWKLKNYPALAAKMRERVTLHANVMGLIRNPPVNIKIIEICPPENIFIGRFNRSKHRLKEGYQMGYEYSQQAIEDWSSV